MSGVGRAEQAVAEAREALLRRLAMSFGTFDADRDGRLVDALVRAVEARCRARVGELPTANSGDLIGASRSHILSTIHPDTQEQP